MKRVTNLRGMIFTKDCVFEPGELVIEDGTIAGSVTNLYDCMKKSIAMGIPKESAIKAATINPARSIGVDKIVGSIEVGKRADILIVNEDMILETIMIGGIIYKQDN